MARWSFEEAIGEVPSARSFRLAQMSDRLAAYDAGDKDA